MVISIIVTLFFYIISIAFLPEYFGKPLLPMLFSPLFILSWCRPLIRRYDRLCMEGGGDRSDQRSSIMFDQGHP
jgi:hypothetical protein